MNNIKDRYNKSKIFFNVLIINIFLSFTINNKNIFFLSVITENKSNYLEINIAKHLIIYEILLFIIFMLPTIYLLFSLLKIKHNKISTYFNFKTMRKYFIEITIGTICIGLGVYFLIIFKGTYWFFNISLISTAVIYIFSSIIEISINNYNTNQMFWHYKIYFNPIVKKSVINKNSKKQSVIFPICVFMIISFMIDTLLYLPLEYFTNFSSRIFFIQYLIIFIWLSKGYILDLFVNQYTKIEGVCIDVIPHSKDVYTTYTVIDYNTERIIDITAPKKEYELGDKITVIHTVFSKRVLNNFLT